MKSPAFVLITAIAFLVTFELSCSAARETVDFNFGWQFHLGDVGPLDEATEKFSASWQSVRLPHDWSIQESYRLENTSSSTGFVPGGIGWYRKSFKLSASERGQTIWIEFDGIYCKSDVWINGQHLGFRPSGYSSFAYDLTDHLHFGDQRNVISVKVDHSAYADCRWYTGSGIYRNVRLVKAAAVHIPQWGVQVTTPSVDASAAHVQVSTPLIGNERGDAKVDVAIIDAAGNQVAAGPTMLLRNGRFTTTLLVNNPQLWGVDSPNLYVARTTVRVGESVVDEVETTFGIRTFKFDADTGFSLNGRPMKLKGVNLHHDAGAVGAAVPKAIWEYRVKKLKSIGVNAIRMSHNPHSVELMEVCDEQGMLAINEFFDEWHLPKGKNIGEVGEGKATDTDATRGYSEYFAEWAERDLKALVRRDFNHPCVIMWSIGNEIEWTFPKYSEAFNVLNPDFVAYVDTPEFDPSKVKAAFDEVTDGVDALATTAKQLSGWVKELDTTRPVTCGSVRPSISTVSGYADAVDVLGFNYRAACYDAAHQTYPDLKILGAENWGAYSEWKNVRDREFVSGMFAWTGFSYLGEAGPWPRKGLNISFFDFAGFKTPRGHFFECLWRDAPKIYMVTSLAEGSEFAYSEDDGWKFEMKMTPPPGWEHLRRWEWYRVNEHWNYEQDEEIIVQIYTNCEEAELLLNGKSLGKQSRADFADDNIIKWLVPFQNGDLTVRGFNDGKVACEYRLATPGEVARIELTTDKDQLTADGYDAVHASVRLLDAVGVRVADADVPITFRVDGPAALLAVDNGWEENVSSHYQPTVTAHNGRALALVRSTDEHGTIKITASSGENLSAELSISAERKR